MADKRKVLVVEDDPMVREFAATLLAEEYDIQTAVDGQDALEKALAWRPDVVVTDLMMPRMHGYELCQRLKAPDGVPGVRILVCSSKPFATDKSQAKAAGADDYIVKPFSIEDLRAKVLALLRGAPSRSSAAAPRPQAPAAAPAPRPAPAPASVAGSARPPMFVRFWGTRGSCATGGPKTARYGGNTSCTEVRVGDLHLIIDCGTGLRELGLQLLKENPDRPIDGHIFVGHTHWDHIQGFPFFTPLYNPKNSFTLYSVRGAHGSLEKVFSGSMASDYFPIPLASLSCRLSFVEMTTAVDFGVARVSFHHLNHPGVCIGFRIEAQGRVVTYLSDHEPFAKLDGDNETSRRQDAAIVEFARGSDVLIGEAQYTEEEYSRKRGWGHSTFDDAVRVALSAEARRLAVFHHDPEHTDELMDAHIEHCRGLIRKAGADIDCFAARDGLKVELP
ncbi:MAG: response regulator [Elusimicrobiota bacterium]|jgi:CheY-like chemotaxis protein